MLSPRRQTSFVHRKRERQTAAAITSCCCAAAGVRTSGYFLVKREGRFSGEAFVVLGSPLQIQMAVDKNKSYMGRRYVEVFRAKKLVSTNLQLLKTRFLTFSAWQGAEAACSAAADWLVHEECKAQWCLQLLGLTELLRMPVQVSSTNVLGP